MRKLTDGTDSPRTLIVAPLGICPADEGNRVRVSRITTLLAEMGHEVWFLGLGLSKSEAKSMQVVWGHRFVHGPKLRTWKIRPLWSAVWRTVLLPPQYLGLICPPVDYWYQPQWDNLVRDLHRDVRFHNVILSYVFLSRAFQNFDERVLKVLDTHDVFTDRDIKLRAARANQRWFRARRSGERKGLLRSDCILAIQDDEAAFFGELIQHERPVFVLGHSVHALPEPIASMPTCIGFIGSGNKVNVRALEWFLDHCWAEVQRNVPKAQLLVCGGVCDVVHPSRFGRGILKGGRIRDTSEFYRSVRVVINSCTVGTGLKIKSIEALGFGRVLICLPEGARGLDPSTEAFVMVPDARRFAEAVIRGLKDDLFVAQISERALAYAREWNATQERTLKGILGQGDREGRPRIPLRCQERPHVLI